MRASATAENRMAWAQWACNDGDGTRERELAVAVTAVQMACALCQRVQEALLLPASQSSSLKTSKDDRSPVTVAGFLTLPSFLFLFFCIDPWATLADMVGKRVMLECCIA